MEKGGRKNVKKKVMKVRRASGLEREGRREEEKYKEQTFRSLNHNPFLYKKDAVLFRSLVYPLEYSDM